MILGSVSRNRLVQEQPRFVAAMNPTAVGGGRVDLPTWFSELLCTLKLSRKCEHIEEVVEALYRESCQGCQDKELVDEAIAITKRLCREQKPPGVRNLQRLSRLHSWCLGRPANTCRAVLDPKDADSKLYELRRQALLEELEDIAKQFWHKAPSTAEPSALSERLLPGSPDWLQEALKRATVSGPFILLTGPTCSGKTSAVQRLAQTEGKQLITIHAQSHSSTADFLGNFMLDVAGLEMGNVVQIRSTTQPLLDGSTGTVLSFDAGSNMCTVLANSTVHCVPLADVQVSRESQLHQQLRFLKGPLRRAMEAKNTWLLVENVNVAPPEAVERLNSLGERLPPELHLMELGSLPEDEEGNLPQEGDPANAKAQVNGLCKAVDPHFRIFFTADSDRPSAKPLSAAFLDRCSVINCLSFDKLYKASQHKEDDVGRFLRQLRTLDSVREVASQSEPFAEALLQLHERMVCGAPKTRSYVPKLVCGAPVNTRTLERVLQASGVFQDAIVPLSLAYSEALLKTAPPKVRRQVQLSAHGVSPRSEDRDFQSCSSEEGPLAANGPLKDLYALLEGQQVHVRVQETIPPELASLYFDQKFLSLDLIGSRLKIGLMSGTLLLQRERHCITGQLTGTLQLEAPERDGKEGKDSVASVGAEAEFFLPLPFNGKLLASWFPSFGEESLSSSFLYTQLQAFDGEAVRDIFPAESMLPPCERMALSAALQTSRFVFQASFAPCQIARCFTPGEESVRMGLMSIRVVPGSDPSDHSAQLQVEACLVDHMEAKCNLVQQPAAETDEAAWMMKLSFHAVTQWDIELRWAGSSAGTAGVWPTLMSKDHDTCEPRSLKTKHLQKQRIALDFSFGQEPPAEISALPLPLFDLLKLLLHKDVESVVHNIIQLRPLHMKMASIQASRFEVCLTFMPAPSAGEDAASFPIQAGAGRSVQLRASAIRMVFDTKPERSFTLLEGTEPSFHEPMTWSLEFAFGQNKICMTVGSSTLDGRVDGDELQVPDLSRFVAAHLREGTRSVQSPAPEVQGAEAAARADQKQQQELASTMNTEKDQLLRLYRSLCGGRVRAMLDQEWLWKQRSRPHRAKVLILLDSTLFPPGEGIHKTSPARHELATVLMILEYLRADVQVVLNRDRDQPVSVAGADQLQQLTPEVMCCALEANWAEEPESNDFTVGLHFTNRPPALLPKSARCVRSLGRLRFHDFEHRTVVEHAAFCSTDSLKPHKTLGNLLEYLFKEPLEGDLRNTDTGLTAQWDNVLAGKFCDDYLVHAGAQNDEELVDNMHRVFASQCLTDATIPPLFTALPLKPCSANPDEEEDTFTSWAKRLIELQGQLQEAMLGDAECCCLWDNLTIDSGFCKLVEHVQDALRGMPPNLFTQVAPSEKGKVLSVPGLIKFLSTAGATKAIWQDRSRGGRVVRSIALVLDPGVPTCMEPDLKFFPLVLALAQALTEQHFSVSIVHPRIGIVKGLSGSWSSRAKGNFIAMCRVTRQEPCQVGDSLLTAAALLLNDRHAQRAVSPAGVRHLFLITHGCSTDGASIFHKMEAWLAAQQVCTWTIGVGDAPTCTPAVLGPLVHLHELWNLPQVAKATLENDWKDVRTEEHRFQSLVYNLPGRIKISSMSGYRVGSKYCDQFLREAGRQSDL